MGPGNLLSNGSFEVPVVPANLPWLTFAPPGMPGWLIRQGTVDVVRSWQAAPGQGSQSLDLVGESPGTIEQTFPTQPGRSYLFSAWVGHNPDNPLAQEGRANVFLNGDFFTQLVHRDPGSTRTHMQWVLTTLPFHAAAPLTTLRLADATGIWPFGGTTLDGLTVTPNQGDLLANGSFEVPDASATTDGVLPLSSPSTFGWEITRGTVSVVAAQHWQPAPGQGSQSLDLAGSAGGGSIEQTVVTQPGRVYVFSGWLSHHPGVPDARVMVSFNGAAQTQLFHSSLLYGTVTAENMQWQPFSYMFLARAPTTTLRLTDVTGPREPCGGAVLDGLTVSPAGADTAGR